MTQVKFKRLEHGAGVPLPAYATDGAACMDVHSAVAYYLRAGESRAIPTGFAVAVPDRWEMQVRPRSGMAAKSGVTVLNSPGTIDSDYRGELMIILINHRDTTHQIKRGDRIAQLSLKRVERFDVCEVDDLDETARGVGGFGSTGV